MKTNTITAGAVLRLTQESDIALLPAIERSAAQAFRQIPSLAWLADSEVISVARHHDYLETEHSLLAVAAGQPVGFILTEPLDDALFIVEVAVHQAWQQQGIGRMLKVPFKTYPLLPYVLVNRYYFLHNRSLCGTHGDRKTHCAVYSR